ncbi:MAG TPA: class I SAM-dependent methyltransferase [Gemmataceae bacterium]|jgi:2-polyprenyl-3-methyl-5-hydroxy-6-metoxy-1,4-benzoquinol methylase|nr:class I SAM-dependent methyltransferase [Gemmataceae bacterium]
MPNPLLAPLDDNSKLIDWIARLTRVPYEQVRHRLYCEERNIGCNVRQELKRRGIACHVWSQRLIDFYRQSDAFLYELVAWNRHPAKLSLRRWVARFLARQRTERRQILLLGDGLGFDSLYLHLAGHDVTYSEISELSTQFARELFAHAGAELPMIHGDAAQLLPESFDVVACLDVLEHVPDPPTFMAHLARALRPGGLLIISAPFWMLTHEYVTHLQINRKYSGRLISLGRSHGLALYDGRWKWEPLVLWKPAPGLARNGNWLNRLAVQFMGSLFATNNITVTPIGWVTRCYRWLCRSPWAADLNPRNGHSPLPLSLDAPGVANAKSHLWRRQ